MMKLSILALVAAMSSVAMAVESSPGSETQSSADGINVQREKSPSTSSNEGVRVQRVIPKAGLMSSTLIYDSPADLNVNRNGLLVGVTADIGASSGGFNIETGLIYQQLGAGAQSTSGPYQAKSMLKLDYVKLPILAKYYIEANGGASFYVKGGPVVGQQVGKPRSEVEISGPGINKKEEQDLEDTNINKTLVGGQLGAGIKFSAGNQNDILIEATYERDFTNLDSTGKNKVYNSAAGLSVGFGLSL